MSKAIELLKLYDHSGANPIDWCRWHDDAAAELRRLVAENVTLNNEVWKRINQYNELDGAAERMSERIVELEMERDELAAKLAELEKQEPVGRYDFARGVVWRDDVKVVDLMDKDLYAAPIPAPVADEREAMGAAWMKFSSRQKSYCVNLSVQDGFLAGWQARAALQPARGAQPALEVWQLQFLTDAVTAAGLLQHGCTDKGLASRLSESAYRWRTSSPAQPAAVPDGWQQIAHDAATSLETISRIAGKAGRYMETMVDVRLYAAARAKVARDDMLAAAPQPKENGDAE